MEGAMGVIVDQHLLRFKAEEEALEQTRGIWIGCALEHAGWNDDQRRSLAGINGLDRLALVLQELEIVVIAISHDSAFTQQKLFRRIGRRLHLQDLLLCELLEILPAQLARQHVSRGHDRTAITGMRLDDLALPLGIEQVGIALW